MYGTFETSAAIRNIDDIVVAIKNIVRKMNIFDCFLRQSKRQEIKKK